MKKIYTIVIAALIILNITSAAVIFSFNSIKTPKTIIQTDITKITEDKINIRVTLKIINQNPFKISLKNLNFISKTQNNYTIGEINFKNITINSQKSKTLYAKENFSFNINRSTNIQNILTGKCTFEIFTFIKKTIPINIKIITSIEKLINEIKPPEFTINSRIKDLNSQGLNLSINTNLYDPNSFQLKIKNLSAILKKDTEIISHIDFKENYTLDEENSNLKTTINIPYTAFEKGELKLYLTGETTAEIAGFTKKINISSSSNINIPNINEFIFKNKTLDFDLSTDFDFTFRGVVGIIGLKIYNPTKIPLIGENLYCSFKRLDNNRTSLLGRKIMGNKTIKTGEDIYVESEITVPYMTFFTKGKGKLFPDKIILGITGDISINGINQSIPISLEAYIDPKLFLGD